MKLENEKTLPRRYFGLHMLPGCAEYQEGDVSFRVFINENTIKQMDSTFEGKPVFVRHGAVNLETLKEDADGYVVRSFYNAADGKHWAEFLVVSDKGHEAIRNGWRLSNCYTPKEFAGGGLWNGISYQKEVKRGQYDHLALVPNPRYDESVVLTPEGFKEYNAKKTLELQRLSNSKGEKTVGLLTIFKKEKVENSFDIEGASVLLPKSKKEVTIAEAVDLADKFVNMAGYANGDHMVKVGEEEMSVKKLSDSYCKMKNSEAERLAAEEEMKKKKENADLDGGEKEAVKQDKKADKTENSSDKETPEELKKAEEAATKAQENFLKLKNAADINSFKDPVEVDLASAERGKSRYGSGK